MKVLALIPSFYGCLGNAINERQLITALSRRVDKCYVITFVGFKQVFTRRRKELKLNLPRNITAIPIPLPEAHILVVTLAMITASCILSVVGLVLSLLGKIDLIYIRNSFLSIGFLAFKSLAIKTVVKIPAIIEDEVPNGGVTKSLIEKTSCLFDRLALAKARKVAVPSKSFCFEVVNRRRFKPARELLVLPAGVDLSLIKKVKAQKDKKHTRNLATVGFIGSLSWWQGVDILAYAMPLIGKEMPSVKLVVIGDGELRPMLEGLCKELNVTYEVTGFLPHEEALRRLSMLDVMVLPSKSISTTESNLPIKVLEAWALGVPVIVTRHRVFVDNHIRGGEDVIYCEPNPESVAKAILLLLNDDKMKLKLAKRGPKLAECFDYAKIVEKIL